GEVGQIDEGLTALTEALATAHHTGERWWEAELYRLQGELLLRRGTPMEEGEACFQQALAVARHQKAKALELRAALSLTRLWGRHRGKRAEALGWLPPIYGCSPEVFDPVALQEPRASREALPNRDPGRPPLPPLHRGVRVQTPVRVQHFKGGSAEHPPP